MKEQQKEEIPDEKIVSPYTSSTKSESNKILILLLGALAVLVILVIFWSIKQIAAENMTTNMVSYVDSSR